MNDIKDKWINDIRDRMDNYSEPLPDGLWETIDSELSGAKIIPLWKKWVSVAAAAVIVVAVSTLSVWFWNSETSLKEVNSSETFKEIINNSPDDETLVVDLSDNNINSPGVAEKNIKPSNSVRTDVNNIVEPVIEVPERILEVDESVSENKKDGDETVSHDEYNSQEQSKEKRIKKMKTDREKVRQNVAYLAMSDSKSKSSGKLQVGVMTGNIPYSTSANFSGMSRLSVSTKSISSTTATSSYGQMLFSNLDRQTYTDIKHHMPVTVGASVKWNLNEKWALETGLNYTYLYSELRSGSKSYIEDKQKLHYVGVPLKAQRSIWNNRLFSFYGAAGGMVEKCVSGTVETVCVDGNNTKNYESEDIGEKPFQFSVLASVGVQANFNKLLSFYVEPGIVYYFDDNSDILTIRKDKPFNFNIQLGLRFSIDK